MHARIQDLVGDEVEQTEAQRPTVAQAARRLGPGQVLAARKGRRKVCVARLDDGRTFAVPDHCPHDGNLLSDGFIDGNRLVCARHGWEFDLDTGTCPLRAGIEIDVVQVGGARDRGNQPAECAGILTTSHEI